MPTREPATGPTERLTASEVTDARDVSPRADEPELKGKRVRAIPAIITNKGDQATTVEIRPEDLQLAGGPELSRTVTWDARVDSSTVVVGDNHGQIPNDVAEFLTGNYPQSFEYMND